MYFLCFSKTNTDDDKSNNSDDILSAALSCAGLKQFKFDEPSIDGTKTINKTNNSDNEIDVGEPVHNMHITNDVMYRARC